MSTEPTQRSIETADDDKFDKSVPMNAAKAIERIGDDYGSEFLEGIIREFVQNSFDGRCENSESRGVISSIDGLNITFCIDKRRDVLEIWDNAGGMPKKTLSDNLLGIDKTGEEKKNGDFTGSYGRGFYVAVSAGDGICHAETRFNGSVWYSQVNGDAQCTPTESKTLEESILSTSGTYVRVNDVPDYVTESMGDYDKFYDALMDSFWRMFSAYDVEVSHIVIEEDGSEKTHSITEPPVDFDEYESDLLEHIGELESYTSQGEEGQVQDIKMYSTENMDDSEMEYISGMSMLKGNTYSEPIMEVHDYKPQLESINCNKMIGFCNANKMCPHHETNDHTLERGARESSGISSALIGIDKEHFKSIPTDKQNQISEQVRDNVNTVLGQTDEEDLNYLGNPQSKSNNTNTRETSLDSEKEQLIDCFACGGYRFEEEEEVDLMVAISNPEGSDIEECEIEANIEGPIDKGRDKSLTIQENESESLQIISGYFPRGKYTFEATLFAINTEAPVGDRRSEEGKSRCTFHVGEVEKDNNTSSSTSTPDLISSVTVTVDDENDWQAFIRPDNENGGYEGIVNIGRQEMQDAGSRNSESTSDRTDIAIRWLFQKICDRYMENLKYENPNMEITELSTERASLFESLTSNYYEMGDN